MTDLKVIHGFMWEHPFALVSSVLPSGSISAVQVPVELSEDGKNLLFHVAAQNELVASFREARECLVVFMGPHAYVSPRWYDAPNVPTWNYMSAQVHGFAQVVTDPTSVIDSLKLLVGRYEPQEFTDSLFSDEDLEHVKKQSLGIVVVKIEIQKLEASFKLSQNRNKANFVNVVKELSKSEDAGAQAIAREMKKLPRA